MPLDGTIEAFTTPDLAQPSFEALAWVLEHPETWPPAWTWDFRRVATLRGCGTAGCAIGIANTLWGAVAVNHFFGVGLGVITLLRPMFLSADTSLAKAIFIEGCNAIEAEQITPAVVAKRIRQHLAGQPITFLGD